MSWPGMASLLLAYAGLALLALAMDKHRKQMATSLKPFVQQSRAVTLGGWLCLATSLLASVVGFGLGRGLTQWFGVLSCAALLVILQVTYLPRSVVAISLASMALGLMSLAL